MRRSLTILAILALGMAFFFLYHGIAKVKVGDVAPAFSIPDETGKNISLESFRGKVVILNFWATGCSPCLAEMPTLESLRRQFADRPFALVLVNRDSSHFEMSVRAVRAFQRLVPVLGTILYDTNGVAANLYGIYSIPHTFNNARDGVVLEALEGFVDWTDPELSDKIRAALGGL